MKGHTEAQSWKCFCVQLVLHNFWMSLKTVTSTWTSIQPSKTKARKPYVNLSHPDTFITDFTINLGRFRCLRFARH